MLTVPLLESYQGKSIGQICPNGYASDHDNHCAHFVAHVLQLGFGVTCATMTKGRHPSGANIKVQALFEKCGSTEEVLQCPMTGEGLIFVSGEKNFHGTPTRIANVPKKHVGLVLNGIVWHYSNTHHRVQKETVGQFLFHYPRQRNALWWGDFPQFSTAINFAAH